MYDRRWDFLCLGTSCTQFPTLTRSLGGGGCYPRPTITIPGAEYFGFLSSYPFGSFWVNFRRRRLSCLIFFFLMHESCRYHKIPSQGARLTATAILSVGAMSVRVRAGVTLHVTVDLSPVSFLGSNDAQRHHRLF